MRGDFFLAVVVAVSLFVFCSTPHKSIIVVRNHFFLKLFALFDLPPWFCRLIVPKTLARDNGQVASIDDFATSPRDGRYGFHFRFVLLNSTGKFHFDCTFLIPRYVQQM
jgi:hypothetical protein